MGRFLGTHNGIAYSMAPVPYPKHQKVVANIWRELDENLECSNKNCEVYLSPIDWKVNDTTIVQPDVVLFCEKTTNQYFSKTPPLVVEVLSKSTALKDVTTKMKLYEREGVKFYIIIEPNTELSDIFELIDGEYQLIKKCTKEDAYKFEMPNECFSEVDFSRVFRR